MTDAVQAEVTHKAVEIGAARLFLRRILYDVARAREERRGGRLVHRVSLVGDRIFLQRTIVEQDVGTVQSECEGVGLREDLREEFAREATQDALPEHFMGIDRGHDRPPYY